MYVYIYHWLNSSIIPLKEKVFPRTKGRMLETKEIRGERGSEESYWCRRLIRLRLEIALDHHKSKIYRAALSLNTGRTG